MNKFLSFLATFLLLTVSSVKAECPPDAINCNLAEGNNGNLRYYPATPCDSYPPFYAKGAPVNREAFNAKCGASVKVYPLDEDMREKYMQRGAPEGATYSPRSQGAYPDGRYGGFAPKSDYNLAETLKRCIEKDLDSKDHNKKIECLDAFDRALNDPSFAGKHKELISILVGFLKTNVPANGSIDRADLNMAAEILARNHRLDRDGCFKFPEFNMDKVKEYLESRSNVVCKPFRKDSISSTDGSYVDPNVEKLAGLTDDEKNATPNNVEVTDASYGIKGPDGRMYKIDSEGRFVDVNGTVLLDPEGNVMTVTGKYKLTNDGSLIGPDGKRYKMDAEGRFVVVDMLENDVIKGPDGKDYKVNKNGEYIDAKNGKKLVGPDGKPVSLDGEYKLSSDGKTVVGPNGERYAITSEGKYVIVEFLGPDGEVIDAVDGGYTLGKDGKTVKGPDGETYQVNSEGKYVVVDLIGPDGKPLDENSKYVISKDGKTVVGPNGEVYKVDEYGRYIGPDGKPVLGDNGVAIGPNGPVVDSASSIDTEALKKEKMEQALREEKYKGLLEENKKLDEARGAEDKLVDAEISSDKYSGSKNIADLNCNPSSCQMKLRVRKATRSILDDAVEVLENRNADVASRLDAICTAKCVSVSDRSLEADAIKALAKYVRRRVPWPLTPKPKPEVSTKSVRPDVQAALIAIGGKDRTSNLGEEINLTAVDLRGANLSEANLENVDLSFSNLSTTNLKNAKGLTQWDKINLVAIDDTTLIPEAVSAGYKVRKKPNILPPEAGSFKIVTDDWIFWKSIPVNGDKKK